MYRSLFIVGLTGLSFAAGQSIGRKPEVHPRLTTRKCTTYGGCTIQDTSVVLDALSHPIMKNGKPCLDSSGELSPAAGPTVDDYAECAIEGADYAAHGVYTRGDSMHMRMYLPINGSNKLDDVSPRVYLLDPTGQEYSYLQLLNQEFTFMVDVSNLPCGMNGALYLSAMTITGGRSALNPAGATYGTGYVIPHSIANSC